MLLLHFYIQGKEIAKMIRSQPKILRETIYIRNSCHNDDCLVCKKLSNFSLGLDQNTTAFPEDLFCFIIF